MGGQKSHSSTHTEETELSKAQAELLKQREAQYQEYFFPQLLQGLQDVSKPTALTPYFQSGVQAVNQRAAQANQQFTQDMARRGLSGSGTESQGLAALANSKSSMLANAYYQAQQANQAQKNQMLQFALSMSPTPSNAAPLRTESHTDGSNWNITGF